MTKAKSPMTMVIVSIKTRERLKNYGKKGDTYDAIIKKLMDFYDKKKKVR